jgi:hypothetical protein
MLRPDHTPIYQLTPFTMYLENQTIVFDTGKTIPCVKEMYSLSENGLFRTLGPDHVVQEHNLNRNEKRELINFSIQRLDALMLMTK